MSTGLDALTGAVRQGQTAQSHSQEVGCRIGTRATRRGPCGTSRGARVAAARLEDARKAMDAEVLAQRALQPLGANSASGLG